MSSTATTSERPTGYFPYWKPRADGVIMPDERLPWGQTILLGVQHVVAVVAGTVINDDERLDCSI